MYVPSSTFIARTNDKNIGLCQSLYALRLTEILASFTACTPARGRHQLYLLPDARETPQPTKLGLVRVEDCPHHHLGTERGPTKVQFRKSTNDQGKLRRLFLWDQLQVEGGYSVGAAGRRSAI
jgi:hypothetical protein